MSSLSKDQSCFSTLSSPVSCFIFSTVMLCDLRWNNIPFHAQLVLNGENNSAASFVPPLNANSNQSEDQEKCNICKRSQLRETKVSMLTLNFKSERYLTQNNALSSGLLMQFGYFWINAYARIHIRAHTAFCRFSTNRLGLVIFRTELQCFLLSSCCSDARDARLSDFLLWKCLPLCFW